MIGFFLIPTVICLLILDYFSIYPELYISQLVYCRLKIGLLSMLFFNFLSEVG